MISVIAAAVLLAGNVFARNSTESTIHLEELSIAKGSVTVSGLSSGGYMAVQMHVAFSSLFSGVGVFAGGPYFCALGSLAIAQEECMYGLMGGPQVDTLVSYTKKQALQGTIDSTENLVDANVYVFSGSKDTTVYPKVVKTLEDYYGAFGVKDMTTVYNIPAQHCMPTTNTIYGEACDKKMSPYIGRCSYDGAEAALETFYGDLSIGVCVYMCV